MSKKNVQWRTRNGKGFLCVLTTCETIFDFQKLLSAFFVVALSECHGQDYDGKALISQQRQIFLFKKIKTFTLKEDFFTYEDDKQPNETDEINYTDLINFDKQIEKLAEEEAKRCSDFDHPNPYYLPDIVKYLMNFVEYTLGKCDKREIRFSK